MNLQSILDNISLEFEIFGDKSLISKIEIDDIALDSRLVKSNSIFFGIIGKKTDGANFLPDIANKNCRVAIISNKSDFDIEKFLKNHPQNIIITGDVSTILTQILQLFYPNLPQNIYAVTGTNGKTSVVEYVRQILSFLQKKSASIGTIGIRTSQAIDCEVAKSSLTTPDIVSLYKNLAFLKQNQIEDVAIEVSSIGLEQKRIDGIKIDCGGFTIFSQDHLDYHQNMAEYFNCKMLLFSQIISPNGTAIINADIPEYLAIKNVCEKRNIKIIDYGFNAEILKIISINLSQIIFEYNQQQFEFSLNLKGDFQVYNVLCSLGLVLAKNNLSNLQIAQLIKNFDKLNSAQGRMQFVGEYNDAKIFIDFAHSPDALENVASLASKIKSHRLILLFGCGGDRDKLKRPIMGKIATKIADIVVITDDNPRTENPQIIRREIIGDNNSNKIIEIADRKIAIETAIQLLQKGDVLIIAGKGHENYQIIGDKKLEFNEEKIVQDVIKKFS